MRHMLLVALLIAPSASWAQTDKIESLTDKIEQQAQQIAQLQEQVARLEEIVLSTTPATQPVAYSTQTPAAAAPAAQSPSEPALVRLSGDLRLRFDGSFRAHELQNARGRYRLRLNADRDVFANTSVHVQLATGAVD